MTDRELMQQALEALDSCDVNDRDIGDQYYDSKLVDAAITALQERLAQPEQGAVAWMNPSWADPDTRGWPSDSFESIPIEGWIPLYTTPPRREWMGLTDEVDELAREMVKGDKSVNWLARAIEAKLKEKNGFLHTKKYVNQIECQRCGRMIV